MRLDSGTADEHMVLTIADDGIGMPAADVARAFGRAWHAEARSALLITPSVVARMERNFVFNTAHPDFARIKPGLETPVWWDSRLFG